MLALQEHAPENLRYAIPLCVVTVNEWVLDGHVPNLAKIPVTYMASYADLIQRHEQLAVARVVPCWMTTFLECVT